MKPTLELDNLSVGYGRRVLLKDLCASILPGQILTLIGPNGAGKSTILKTISHHLACMGGVVRIGGENIERMDSCELAKRLSVVLTERVRPELMTCYDVAASGRYPYTGRFGMLTALDRDVIAQSLALVRAEELAVLNIPGDIQLSADSLLLSSHFGQIGNIIFKLFHHKVERVT